MCGRQKVDRVDIFTACGRSRLNLKYMWKKKSRCVPWWKNQQPVYHTSARAAFHRESATRTLTWYMRSFDLSMFATAKQLRVLQDFQVLILSISSDDRLLSYLCIITDIFDFLFQLPINGNIFASWIASIRNNWRWIVVFDVDERRVCTR